MKEPIDNYFTTGELAKLCKIPRKTLLYYDSLGLITQSFSRYFAKLG